MTPPDQVDAVARAFLLEREQWRKVWPTIGEFTFRLDELRCLGSGDSICVVVPWDSLGKRADGELFPRPGRATGPRPRLPADTPTRARLG